MPPSDFRNANIDEIVDQLTTDEAISLTAGVGFWHTHEIPRLGIPAIKVSLNHPPLTVISPLTPRSAMAQMASVVCSSYCTLC